MSRLYGMTLSVKNHDHKKRNAILKEACTEWNFDTDVICVFKKDTPKENIFMEEAVNNLCGGESEDEFAERISKSVMRANKGPCNVTVHTVCYENIPRETFDHNEELWEEMQEEEANDEI